MFEKPDLAKIMNDKTDPIQKLSSSPLALSSKFLGRSVAKKPSKVVGIHANPSSESSATPVTAPKENSTIIDDEDVDNKSVDEKMVDDDNIDDEDVPYDEDWYDAEDVDVSYDDVDNEDDYSDHGYNFQDVNEHIAKKPRLNANDDPEEPGLFSDALGCYAFSELAPSDDETPGKPATSVPSQQEPSKKRKPDDIESDEAATTSSDAAEDSDSDSGSDPVSDSVRDEKLEKFRKKNFVHLIKQLSGFIGMLPVDKCKVALEIVGVLKEKYKKKYQKSPDNNVPHPRTAKEIIERLEGEEEDEHPWKPTEETVKKTPKFALRAFTDTSQSRLSDNRVGFQSRKSYGSLDTKEARRIDMLRHSKWENRHLTPLISTSSSWAHIFATFIPTFKKRYTKKGNPDNTKVALISFTARLAAGKPVISIIEEGLHYGVWDKMQLILGCLSVFDKEYLCPYEIGPNEIVCTWRLDEVEQWMDDWKKRNIQSWTKPNLTRGRGRPSRRWKALYDAQTEDERKNDKKAADAFQEQVAKLAYEKHEIARLMALH